MEYKRVEENNVLLNPMEHRCLCDFIGRLANGYVELFLIIYIYILFHFIFLLLLVFNLFVLSSLNFSLSIAILVCIGTRGAPLDSLGNPNRFRELKPEPNC